MPYVTCMNEKLRADKAGLHRDEILLRLLKAPPQPRPKRERDKSVQPKRKKPKKKTPDK